MEELSEVFKQLWECFAPSNVLVFVWRALWGRIQSKLNLHRRGILANANSLACVCVMKRKSQWIGAPFILLLVFYKGLELMS